MSAVAPVSTLSPISIKPGQVMVIGKLAAVRKAGQQWLHLIVMPSADAYSSPSTVEVGASGRLGQKDDEVKVLCKLSGYRRSYKSVDQETGESRQVQTADNRLFAVEE